MYQQFDAGIVPLVCIFIKNKTPVQVLSCEFYKIFKNNYLAEHLQKAACNDMILARLSMYLSMYLFNIFDESKDRDHITTLVTCLDKKTHFFHKKRFDLQKQ